MEGIWDWTSVDGTIHKRTVEKGGTGERPNASSRCRYVINANEEHFLVLGNAESASDFVVERVLMTMTIGEVAEVMSNHFVGLIRLVHFERGRDPYEMSPSEKFKLAESCKELGVTLYKAGNDEAALRQFIRAAQLLIFLRRRNEENAQLFLVVTSNLAQVHLNLGRLEDAVLAANKVLEIHPENVKALLRRATAHQRLRDFEKSRDDLVKVLELEPSNPTAKTALPVVKKEIANMFERYENMVKRMFK